MLNLQRSGSTLNAPVARSPGLPSADPQRHSQAVRGRPGEHLPGAVPPRGPPPVTPAADIPRGAPVQPERLEYLGLVQRAGAVSGPYAAALEGGGTVQTVISDVELIVLGRDQHLYEWTTRADIRLAGDTADLPGEALR
jgi:hypothetical protein